MGGYYYWPFDLLLAETRLPANGEKPHVGFLICLPARCYNNLNRPFGALGAPFWENLSELASSPPNYKIPRGNPSPNCQIKFKTNPTTKPMFSVFILLNKFPKTLCRSMFSGVSPLPRRVLLLCHISSSSPCV